MAGNFPQLVVSNKNGEIYNVPHLEAVGMKQGRFFRFDEGDLIKLPAGSELFYLPDRLPAAFDRNLGNFLVLKKGPLAGKPEKVFAVAAFVCSGYTTVLNAAYKEINRPNILPLFSYAAAAFYKGGLYVASVRVDKERRHDNRFIDIELVKRNAAKAKKRFSGNRLIRHLETCALCYGCVGAKNFFLGKYEAPLPTSPLCNAGCAGCISYQPKASPPPTQPRIKFIPTPQEIAQAAIFHSENVRDPVFSFGQGCEGEPLLAGDVIEKAIRIIRENTKRGMININTNASKPEVISKLFDAGLDSVRVSLNSAQKRYYSIYYRPRGYEFRDVIKSIKTAKNKGGFVCLNYLVMPGFTDSNAEFTALKNLIEKYKIDMIQWRNLNFDPVRYFKKLNFSCKDRELLGAREIIASLKKSFPRLMMGYYNPSKGRIAGYSRSH